MVSLFPREFIRNGNGYGDEEHCSPEKCLFTAVTSTLRSSQPVFIARHMPPTDNLMKSLPTERNCAMLCGVQEPAIWCAAITRLLASNSRTDMLTVPEEACAQQARMPVMPSCSGTVPAIRCEVVQHPPTSGRVAYPRTTRMRRVPCSNGAFPRSFRHPARWRVPPVPGG